MNDISAGLSFAAPLYLWFLLADIPLLILSIVHFRAYHRARPSAALFLLSALFFVFSFNSLIIALSQPSWGYSLQPRYQRGADIVLALDLSRSMELEDAQNASATYPVSRIEAGLLLIRDLLKAPEVNNCRLAIALGKGRGLLAVPLTDDFEAIGNLVNGLKPTALSGTGTNLEALLDTALSAFDLSFPSQKSIILFSDGENLSGSLSAAAEKARSLGIPISCVGLGSMEGMTLVSNDMPILSRLHQDSLEYLAELTEGIYTAGPAALPALLASPLFPHSGRLDMQNTQVMQKIPTPRAHIFIVAGILFFILSKTIQYRKEKQ
ncbi:aerotolerance regulator BatB [Spirochaetia bacterium]|nr:aerotolerance regulator BatB [Spirochaetia bacterium]